LNFDRVAALLWLTLAAVSPGAAQAQVGPTPATMPAPAASSAGVLSRTGFFFEWMHLSTPDPRFEWMGTAGVDFDIVDYRTGRVHFAAEVQGGLGRERRRYDLNHGDYRFGAAATMRVNDEVEIEAIAQHVSRHLIDREQIASVSWNAFGARARYLGRQGLSGWLEIATVTQPAFVDYRWIARAEAHYTRATRSRLSPFVLARGEVIGVDPATRGATRVCGGLIEGGLRIAGRAANLDLFVAYERRVDAFPTDRFRVRWVALGFRVAS
jgi:hypothetical protein